MWPVCWLFVSLSLSEGRQHALSQCGRICAYIMCIQHCKKVNDHFSWSWVAMTTSWSKKLIIHEACELIMANVMIILGHDLHISYSWSSFCTVWSFCVWYDLCRLLMIFGVISACWSWSVLWSHFMWHRLLALLVISLSLSEEHDDHRENEQGTLCSRVIRAGLFDPVLFLNSFLSSFAL